MEQQRRLRLGDILDDYCPRERRVTNHAIVAMVEDDVKQTRCTTCDAEHVYKGGKAPRRKKGDTTKALYKEVLAGMTDEPAAAPALPVEPVVAAVPAPVVSPVDAEPEDRESLAQQTLEDRESMEDPEDDEIQPDMPTGDEGPVHRQLIRAQLPRVEGVKVERQAPDFTIRQNNLRGGGGQNFRGGDARAHGRPSNNGGGGGSRFGRGPQQRSGGGGRGGTNQGFGRGAGGGQQRQGGGNGPRKRGR
jgi:hypothetical protein